MDDVLEDLRRMAVMVYTERAMDRRHWRRLEKPRACVSCSAEEEDEEEKEDEWGGEEEEDMLNKFKKKLGMLPHGKWDLLFRSFLQEIHDCKIY